MGDEWQATAEGFRRHLLASGRSRDTASTYAAHLWPFWKFTSGEPLSATHDDVEAYLAMQLASVSHSTTHVRLSAVKAFFRWKLKLRDKQEPPQTDGLTVKKDKRQPRPPCSDSDVDHLFAACETESDRLQFELDFACGLRVSELAGLERKDLFLENGRILIRGKGSYERWVAPDRKLLERLAAFCGKRTGSVFEMTREQIRRRMVRLAKKAGVVNFHTHKARRTFATRFWRSTGDLLKLQLLLGHASAETTRRYADFDAVEAALDSQRLLAERMRPA